MANHAEVSRDSRVPASFRISGWLASQSGVATLGADQDEGRNAMTGSRRHGATRTPAIGT